MMGSYESATRLLTLAMVAEVAGATRSQVRRWLARGWLIAARVERRMPLLSFAELNVARQLAELHRAGVSARQIERALEELRSGLPQVARPLAEVTWILDGRRILIREGDQLRETSGQLRLAFEDSVAESATDYVLSLPVADSLRFVEARRDASAHFGHAGEQLTPDQLAACGIELADVGDLAGAMDLLRAAMAAGGPTPELCFELADVFVRSGDLAAARERLLMALELDADFPEARVRLADVFLKLGDEELAVATLEGALANYETFVDAHLELARLLDSLGRRTTATPHWQFVLENSPVAEWQDEARRALEVSVTADVTNTSPATTTRRT